MHGGATWNLASFFQSLGHERTLRPNIEWSLIAFHFLGIRTSIARTLYIFVISFVTHDPHLLIDTQQARKYPIQYTIAGHY